jgi:hypothetical protein
LKITTRRHQIINGKTIRIYHKTNTEKQKGELCAEKGLYGVDNEYLKVKLWQFIKKFTTHIALSALSERCFLVTSKLHVFVKITPK